MDFIYVDDIARANILAADARRHRRGVQRRAAASRPACADLAAMLLKVMGVDLAPEHGPARSVNPVPRRLAERRKAPPSCSASKPRSDLEEGLRELVAWWRRTA